MKPHTRIIYYTLLCLALNHRRSRACIYGGTERERALCFCLRTYLHQCVYVCVYANVCMGMYGCKHVSLYIITQVDVVALQLLINYLNANY